MFFYRIHVFIWRPNRSKSRTQVNQVLKKRYRAFFSKFVGKVIYRVYSDNFIHHYTPYNISLVLNPFSLSFIKALSTSGGNFPYHSKITGLPVDIYFLSCETIFSIISSFSSCFSRENPGQYF